MLINLVCKVTRKRLPRTFFACQGKLDRYRGAFSFRRSQLITETHEKLFQHSFLTPAFARLLEVVRSLAFWPTSRAATPRRERSGLCGKMRCAHFATQSTPFRECRRREHMRGSAIRHTLGSCYAGQARRAACATTSIPGAAESRARSAGGGGSLAIHSRCCAQ